MSKVIVVVAIDEPEVYDPGLIADLLERLEPIFADKSGVSAYAAIRESADRVLAVFEDSE